MKRRRRKPPISPLAKKNNNLLLYNDPTCFGDARRTNDGTREGTRERERERGNARETERERERAYFWGDFKAGRTPNSAPAYLPETAPSILSSFFFESEHTLNGSQKTLLATQVDDNVRSGNEAGQIIEGTKA
jgi:hypothetical protein